MAATYMLRKHIRSMELSGRPEAVAERRVSKEANDRALAETRKKFPVITADNFEAADTFRRDRVEHWQRELH